MDGACGTMLQTYYGLNAGEKPESWCISQPQIIKELHLRYLQAGSDVILANTFGANRLKFGLDAPNIVKSAVRIAKEAIAMNDGKGYVALDIGPTGKLIYPFGDLLFEEAYETFKEMVLSSDGADLVVIETMTDLYELKAAILAVKENSNLPIIASVTLDALGKTLTGADLENVVCLIEGLGANVLGLNCGFGPQKMLEWLPDLIKYTNLPIMIKPNAGMPFIVNNKLIYDTDENDFAVYMEKAVKMGVRLIGGCCGTTPDYIKKLIPFKNKIIINAKKTGASTRICSYGKTVNFGDRPIIIGERLNPTGKPLLKEALRKKDFEYLRKEAVRQVEAGADVLDVNVGLPDISEQEMLKEVVVNLQAITDSPLQIDTADILAMEPAIRAYNGIPLINSVNGKKESMDVVFPLMKKYGGVAVALMLDEKGIPDEPEERISIARKIIKEAQKYGIGKERFLFDPLALTVSTGFKNALNVLEIIRKCRDSLGVNTVLGVSNVSFGLPNRSLINSAFFAEVLEAGLSAAIIDPTNKAVLGTYHAHNALHGHDKNFVEYIRIYSSNEETKTEYSDYLTLEKAVTRGLSKEAAKLTEVLLQSGKPALLVVNEILIPTLDKIGKSFETGAIFLPQLLSSAESAKQAFAVIKNELNAKNQHSKSKGTIVLATVEGDIHDIGKNIVKVILENYGYSVIDLGRDVKKEQILDTIKSNKVGLVGLSALMTTTVSNMEKTIRYLKENISVPVMVGGAVLTEPYSKKIGADFYAKDAMASVRIADLVFSD